MGAEMEGGGEAERQREAAGWPGLSGEEKAEKVV